MTDCNLALLADLTPLPKLLFIKVFYHSIGSETRIEMDVRIRIRRGWAGTQEHHGGAITDVIRRDGGVLNGGFSRRWEREEGIWLCLILAQGDGLWISESQVGVR